MMPRLHRPLPFPGHVEPRLKSRHLQVTCNRVSCSCRCFSCSIAMPRISVYSITFMAVDRVSWELRAFHLSSMPTWTLNVSEEEQQKQKQAWLPQRQYRHALFHIQNVSDVNI